jgi:hypothetical protein
MNRADVLLACKEDKNSTARLNCRNLNSFVSHLQGTVLTVVDASIADKTQCEAVKSLIKNALWEPTSTVYQWIHDQKDKNGSNFPF